MADAATKERLFPKQLKLFINGEFVDAVSKKTVRIIVTIIFAQYNYFLS